MIISSFTLQILLVNPTPFEISDSLYTQFKGNWIRSWISSIFLSNRKYTIDFSSLIFQQWRIIKTAIWQLYFTTHNFQVWTVFCWLFFHLTGSVMKPLGWKLSSMGRYIKFKINTCSVCIVYERGDYITITKKYIAYNEYHVL